MTLLARHALRTLPDSLHERRLLLAEIIRRTAKDSDERITARLLLTHLDQHEHQRALPVAMAAPPVSHTHPKGRKMTP